MYNGENITYKQDLSFSEIINSFDRAKNRMIILVIDSIYKDINDSNYEININSTKEDNYTILLNKINLLENRINKLEDDKKSEINEKNSISLKYEELKEKYLNLNNNIKNIEKEINNIKEMIKKVEDNNYFLNKLYFNIDSALNQNALIKNISNDIKILNEKNKDNYITLKLNIEKNDVGKEIPFLKQRLFDNRYIHNFEIDDIVITIDNLPAKKYYKYINKLNYDNTASQIYSKLNNSIYFYHIFKGEGFHSIKVIFNKKLSSCAELFRDCNKIYEIDLSNFDDSQIDSCYSMFYNCTNLHKVNFGSLDFSLCTSFDHMFYKCNNLDELDLFNFDTKNAKSFSYMFYQCKNLKELYLFNFDTKNSKSFSSMFYGCTNLKDLDISNFNTSSCEDIGNMFNSCENITEINMIDWDMSKIKRFRDDYTGLENLFKGCKKLELIKMNCNFSNLNNLLKSNGFCHEYINGIYTPTRYEKVIVFSELPKDGTFIYKNGKNMNYLLNRLPKNWKKIQE